MKDRWNIYEEEPIKDVSQLFHLLRRVLNTDPDRLVIIKQLIAKHKRLIIFYNFNYELDILRTLNDEFIVAEWNGQKHEPIPQTDSWVYLVQYNAGAEGWNCVETNAIAFYSLNYSHKMVVQAGGRIDRLNTPYTDLYYYHISSRAPIDIAIQKSVRSKKNFHESNFIKE